MYETECQEAEAKLFTTRNADSEKMIPEEIFKGKLVYKDTTALLQLDLLKRCGIDVAGLNPKGKTLGGFKAFDDRWQSWDEEWLLLSSRICQAFFCWGGVEYNRACINHKRKCISSMRQTFLTRQPVHFKSTSEHEAYMILEMK